MATERLLQFYYGTIDKNIPITDMVYSKCLVEHCIYIPSDDNVRANLFTDPCFKIVKLLFVVGLSESIRIFDDSTDIVIDLQTLSLISDPMRNKQLCARSSFHSEQKLDILLSKFELEGLSSCHEQYAILDHVQPNAHVLQLGGNLGSLLVASILDDERKFVLIDSDVKRRNCVEKNRNTNGYRFRILDCLEPVVLNESFDTLLVSCIEEEDVLIKILTHVNSLHTILFGSGWKESIALYMQARGFVQNNTTEHVWKRHNTHVSSHIEESFMKSFPHVFLFRLDKYSYIDQMFEQHRGDMHCSLRILQDVSELRAMADPNYAILVTYGPDEKEYVQDVGSYLPQRMSRRWIHMHSIQSVESFVQKVNYCFVDNVLQVREEVRPVFSIFTTCYKSYDKILRVYESLLRQTWRDWEWIVLDDSPDSAHFAFLQKRFCKDSRIRLYKRSVNSGNIGNVKNEAVSLCRGRYVLEMDHDDEILEDVLQDAVRVFLAHPDVGFVYMDFINVYEDFRNFWYGDFICKGYGGYYMQKFRGSWVEVYITPNINNITLSHIVCLPNHPRIWRRECLLRIGNYSEFLPICDDQELLMRTALETKMAKLPKLGYIQYMNDNANNFSLIRNKEINRIGPQFLVPQFYKQFDVHERMRDLGAYEDTAYVTKCSPIWKREDYAHVYCNLRMQYDYDTQYCIVGLDVFLDGLGRWKTLYENPRNDFLVMDANVSKSELCAQLDRNGFSRMKCYVLPSASTDEMVRYFHLLYKSCETVLVIASSTKSDDAESSSLDLPQHSHLLQNDVSCP